MLELDKGLDSYPTLINSIPIKATAKPCGKSKEASMQRSQSVKGELCK